MKSIKKAFWGLLIAAVVCSYGISAQAKDGQSAKSKAKAPMVIEGDELSFSDLTGEIYAKGNVVITQDQQTILSDLLHGNSKQSEVWIDGNATILQPNVRLVGVKTHFNYKTNTGSMKSISGTVDRQLVAGENVDMVSQKEIIIHNGTMTTCPAKVPDYHVSATKIEIWPGDKLIAYNAKMWIKDKVIYAMPKYQKSLKKDGKSEFPQVGYNSSEGWFVKQYLEYPLSNKVAAFSDLVYYSKRGFKPSSGIIDRETNYSLSVIQGSFTDANNNWIEKKPEFGFIYNTRRMVNLPVSYAFTAAYGRWIDATKSSWHQDYNLYLSRDVIKIDRSLFLHLGTGIELVRESYNGSSQILQRFDFVLTKHNSPNFTTWLGYHYVKNNNTVFEYNSADLSKQLDAGFAYRFDRMNSVKFNQSYDLQNKQIYDQDVTWIRDLHCWQATITYRIKRHQLTWDLSVKRW